MFLTHLMDKGNNFRANRNKKKPQNNKNKNKPLWHLNLEELTVGHLGENNKTLSHTQRLTLQNKEGGGLSKNSRLRLFPITNTCLGLYVDVEYEIARKSICGI